MERGKANNKPEKVLANIRGVVYLRRGLILEERQSPHSMLYTIRAHLLVIESMGFTDELRAATSGQAFGSQCVFDHWAILPSDPLESGSHASQLVADIRMRKGMKELRSPVFEDKQ